MYTEISNLFSKSQYSEKALVANGASETAPPKDVETVRSQMEQLSYGALVKTRQELASLQNLAEETRNSPKKDAFKKIRDNFSTSPFATHRLSPQGLSDEEFNDLMQNASILSATVRKDETSTENSNSNVLLADFVVETPDGKGASFTLSFSKNSNHIGEFESKPQYHSLKRANLVFDDFYSVGLFIPDGKNSMDLHAFKDKYEYFTANFERYFNFLKEKYESANAN